MGLPENLSTKGYTRRNHRPLVRVFVGSLPVNGFQECFSDLCSFHNYDSPVSPGVSRQAPLLVYFLGICLKEIARAHPSLLK